MRRTSHGVCWVCIHACAPHNTIIRTSSMHTMCSAIYGRTCGHIFVHTMLFPLRLPRCIREFAWQSLGRRQRASAWKREPPRGWVRSQGTLYAHEKLQPATKLTQTTNVFIWATRRHESFVDARYSYSQRTRAQFYIYIVHKTACALPAFTFFVRRFT